jgi:hypothetical protein
VHTVRASAIRERLDGMRGVLVSNTPLDALKDQMSEYRVSVAACVGDPPYDLAIAGLEVERDADALDVPTRDFKSI